MVDDQLASGSLDDPPPVGGGVVRLSLAESDSLGHFWSVFGGCKDLRDGRAVVLLFVVEVLREGEQAGERGRRYRRNAENDEDDGSVARSSDGFHFGDWPELFNADSIALVRAWHHSFLHPIFDDVRCHL